MTSFARPRSVTRTSEIMRRRGQATVLAALAERGNMAEREISNALESNRSRTWRILQQLLDARLVQRTGQQRSGRYGRFECVWGITDAGRMHHRGEQQCAALHRDTVEAVMFGMVRCGQSFRPQNGGQR